MEKEKTPSSISPACYLCKGACCETFGLAVNQKQEDFYRWLKYHGEATEEGIRFDCRCKMLQDGLCSVYEDRPTICKVYPVGGKHCLNAIDTRRYKIRHEIKRLIHAAQEEGS